MLRRLRRLGRLAHKSGPYLLLEILLPGGTLFALLLFLYQRRQGKSLALHPQRLAITVASAVADAGWTEARAGNVLPLFRKRQAPIGASSDDRLAA